MPGLAGVDEELMQRAPQTEQAGPGGTTVSRARLAWSACGHVTKCDRYAGASNTGSSRSGSTRPWTAPAALRCSRTMLPFG